MLDQLHDRASPLVFYIGDDQTDEDAFASLPDGVTAKVGPGSSAHGGLHSLTRRPSSDFSNGCLQV